MTEPIKIGSATLYHGDAREVLAILPAESVDLIFTDPPYGHNNNNGDLIHRREEALGRGKCGEARAIASDGPEANDLFRGLLPEMARVLKPGHCCCCCCCGGGPDPQFARWSLWMDEVFDFKQMIVWDKGPMGMGWHYRRSYETVLVAQKRGAACHWCTDRKDVENVIRPGSGIRKIIPRSHEHPTAKPPELAGHFMTLHSLSGGVVLDPFMGAGSTGEMAIKMGRRFIGIEIDPHWFGVAKRRIADAMPLFEEAGG